MAGPNYGTLSTLDTLASTFQTIAEFGEDRATDQILALLTAHNKIAANLFDDLCDKTTDRQRRYGTPDNMLAIKTDEFGRSDPQKVSPGAVAGFPLDKYTVGVQYTRDYFDIASVAEVVAQSTAAMDGDVQRIISEIKRAIYSPTNYTFNDYLVNRLQAIPLQVRALLNADGLGIPAGPNGEIFNGSTHTHYLGVATPGTPLASEIVAALETVEEHYSDGNMIIAINRAQEPQIRAMTGNFVAMQPQMVVGPTTAAQIPGQMTPTVPIYNRMIGLFNGAEVWVKPWCIAGFVVPYITDQPKPLVMRTNEKGPQGFVLVAEDEKYPLRAKLFQRKFGVGVWNRTAMSVLDTLHTTYNAPVII